MKNKKTVIILILVLLVGIVGLSLAYFANSTSVDNIFNTQPYGTTVTEEFTSPSNWLPGDTTSKVLTATNTGNVDEAVRIRLNESWRTANNGTLNGWIHPDGTKSTHTTNDELSNDERVAIINFDNLSDWTYSNGYYYYNYKLAPNETTSSLIKSVTFNSKTKLDDTCVTTTNGSTKTITCNSSGDDYDNATYTLTFTVETVQYNKYQDAWNTNVSIAAEKTLTYKIGDEVIYDNAKYYVLYDSGVDQSYLTLLKTDVLTADEVNEYGDYNSSNGEYIYKSNWNKYSFNFQNSDVRQLLNNWSEKYDDDLIEIDNYKVRLLNSDDLIDSLGYEISGNATYLTSNMSESTPEWVVINGKRYWGMDFLDDKNWNSILGISDVVTSEAGSNELYVRPVINLKKSALGIVYNDSNKYYSIGDTVTYKNNEYCVIYDKSANNYVTLIS